VAGYDRNDKNVNRKRKRKATDSRGCAGEQKSIFWERLKAIFAILHWCL